MENQEPLVKAVAIPEEPGALTDTELAMELTFREDGVLNGFRGSDSEEPVICSIVSTLIVAADARSDAVGQGDVVLDFERGYIDDPDATVDGYTGPITQLLLGRGTGFCKVTNTRLYGYIAKSDVDAESLRSGKETGRYLCYSLPRTLFFEASVKGGRWGRGNVEAAELDGSFQLGFEEPKYFGANQFSDERKLRPIPKAELDSVFGDVAASA